MAKNKPKSAAPQKATGQPKSALPSKPKPASPPVAAAPAKSPAPAPAKPSKKSALRESILARKAAAKPIAFSLDEVRAIAKTNAAKTNEAAAKAAKGAPKVAPVKPPAALERPAKPNHIKAASLADILGFNPKKVKSVELVAEQDVPEMFRRYYRILVDMRTHLTEGIERHSEESLKRSAKDDAGDLVGHAGP